MRWSSLTIPGLTIYAVKGSCAFWLSKCDRLDVLVRGEEFAEGIRRRITDGGICDSDLFCAFENISERSPVGGRGGFSHAFAAAT